MLLITYVTESKKHNCYHILHKVVQKSHSNQFMQMLKCNSVNLNDI